MSGKEEMEDGELSDNSRPYSTPALYYTGPILFILVLVLPI